MTRALYAGSFDPPTTGHLDIITRASAIVSELVVGIGVHPDKTPFLDADTRLELMRQDCAHLPNLTFTFYTGATVRFAAECGAKVLVRGLRSYADMNAERGMAEINRREGYDTLFLLANSQHVNLSSTVVRHVMDAGLSLDGLVSPRVAEALHNKS